MGHPSRELSGGTQVTEGSIGRKRAPGHRQRPAGSLLDCAGVWGRNPERGPQGALRPGHGAGCECPVPRGQSRFCKEWPGTGPCGVLVWASPPGGRAALALVLGGVGAGGSAPFGQVMSPLFGAPAPGRAAVLSGGQTTGSLHQALPRPPPLHLCLPPRPCWTPPKVGMRTASHRALGWGPLEGQLPLRQALLPGGSSPQGLLCDTSPENAVLGPGHLPS